MNTNDVAIRVEHLTKSFKIPTESSSGIKQKLINLLKGRKGYRVFTPLEDISFEVNKGDFFGIVGRNGSGKSTLLKSIANIYTPSKGSVMVNGTLVPFIELGVGFNPELTGRENVFLNGALLGFSREEMEAMYSDIVAFAEISEFMDEKLKNYSSGMQVRLAFSIAIRAQGDILLLDEVLAVGDEAFQRKCYTYFAELKKKKKTVIIVTHDMDAVQRYCNKAIMIEAGRIVSQGSTSDVAHSYQELFAEQERKQVNTSDGSSNDLLSCDVEFEVTDDIVTLNLTYNMKADIPDAVLTVGMNRDNGEQVFRWFSDDDLGKLLDLRKNDKYKLTFKLQNIYPVGSYTIGVRVKNQDNSQNFAVFDDIKKVAIPRRKDSYTWDTIWNPSKDVKLEKFK